MTQKLKGFLERHNYKITAVNTILIITDIAIQSLQKPEQVNKETQILLKKSDQLAKENTTLIYRIKMYIQKYIRNAGVEDEKAIPLNRSQGIIPENDTKPVVEIHVPDGVDSIRGSFFYRLFHKNKIYLRPYKMINDEKINNHFPTDVHRGLCHAKAETKGKNENRN